MYAINLATGGPTAALPAGVLEGLPDRALQDDAAFEVWRAALLASGEASAEDIFIRRVVVDPSKGRSI